MQKIELKKSEKKSVTLEVMEKTLTQIYWFGFSDEGTGGIRDPYGDSHPGTKLRHSQGAFYEKPLSHRTAIMNELIRQGLLNSDFSVTPKGEQYCLECGYRWNFEKGSRILGGYVFGYIEYFTQPLEVGEKGKAKIKEASYEVIKNKVSRRPKQIFKIMINCPCCGDFEFEAKDRKIDRTAQCPKCGYTTLVLSAENDLAYREEILGEPTGIKYYYSPFGIWRWINSGEVVPDYITKKFRGYGDI